MEPNGAIGPQFLWQNVGKATFNCECLRLQALVWEQFFVFASNLAAQNLYSIFLSPQEGLKAAPAAAPSLLLVTQSN